MVESQSHVKKSGNGEEAHPPQPQPPQKKSVTWK